MLLIRRIQVGEAPLFKKMRLAALREAPYAFSSTYESASRRSEESWQEQADSTAEGADRATFIVFSEDVPVGLAALYRLAGQSDAGELLQVWVMPEYRGKAVACNLVDAVFEWARENGFRRLFATITKGNTRALEFYRKYGFMRVDEAGGGPPGGTLMVREVDSERSRPEPSWGTP